MFSVSPKDGPLRKPPSYRPNNFPEQIRIPFVYRPTGNEQRDEMRACRATRPATGRPNRPAILKRQWRHTY